MKHLILFPVMVFSLLIAVKCTALASEVPSEVSSERSPGEKSWNFKVYLDQKEIGYQSFKLLPKPDGSQVSIEAKFDVEFFFINVYSYRHNNSETWKNGCLQSIESKTDDNGDNFFVMGSRADNGFAIKSHAGEQQLQGCVKTFSYWDASFLNSTRLLNSQTGEYQSVQVRELGNVEIDVLGKPTSATHYHISTSDFQIDLWYSPDRSEWLALQSTTAEGSVLRYKRALPEMLPMTVGEQS